MISNEQFIKPEHYKTQDNLNQIAAWTINNLMKINEEKTKYIMFTRTRKEFATRLQINEKVIERVKTIKLLGIWLQEDGGLNKNTKEMCRRAYSRISMLTKLKYAGVSTENLILLYKLHIRSCLEYVVVAWHSSLSSQQEATIERCQVVCLKIILQESFVSYEAALEMTGLGLLSERRTQRCITFSKKCLQHSTNKRFFPENLNPVIDIRNKERFKVNFAYTAAYKNSAIPYCQRLLNQLEERRREEEKRR